MAKSGGSIKGADAFEPHMTLSRGKGKSYCAKIPIHDQFLCYFYSSLCGSHSSAEDPDFPLSEYPFLFIRYG
ncbi:hypothetical protein CEXT_402651 [Caerostris extrusa]|uniref:Uncharacterized protein n=1 Tax=Caerostris extrusa TaxID=172846 RepID=A0AAV4WA73_CAEEX|nr:hypothetical protein CEXT_402651 [Caerostris extrusa]